MKKKATVRKLLCPLFCLVFTLSVLVIPASAAVYTMDNDALPNSGVTNPKQEIESYGWFNMDYITNDNYVNDDARIGNSSAGCRYCWKRHFPASTITLYAYLWDTRFTDPSAKYGTLSTLYSSNFGTLNQDRATYGWNEVGTAYDVRRDLYGVTSSGKAGTYLGADAIQVRY